MTKRGWRAGWRQLLAVRCLAVPVLLACGLACGPTAQQRYAATLRPAELALAEAPAARAEDDRPPRVFRVRVWAASDYRSEVYDWQRRCRSLLARVNRLIGPAYRAELEAVELRAWERTTHGESLAALLADLERLDPGEGVDWVVGLVTAEATVSGNHDQSGMANLLGRHFVVRNLVDIVEYKAIEKGLYELDRGARDALFKSRFEHKQLAVFLHEWGHSLGALHVNDPRSLMSATYDYRASDFSRANAELVEIGLASRATPGGQSGRGPAQLAALRRYFRAHNEADWETRSRDQMASLLGLSAIGVAPAPPRGPATVTAAAPAAPTKATPGAQPGPASADDRAQLDEAAAAARQADYARAWARASPVAQRRPEDPTVQGLACEMGCRARADDPTAFEACAAAERLQPARIEFPLFHASALLDRKRVAEARAVLSRLAALLTTGAHQGPYASMAAPLFQQAMMPIEAAAVARVVKNRPVAEWSSWVSQVYALPDNAAALGLGPDDEAAYVETQDRVRAAFARGDVETGDAELAAFEARYDRLPARHVLRCQRAAVQRNWVGARNECEAALALADRAVLAHTELGRALVYSGEVRGGIDHLERARELDPSVKATWQLLARALKAAGPPARLTALRGQYQERFGEKL